MNYFSAAKRILVLFLLFNVVLFNNSFAQDKPLLSETIRDAIETKGVEGAKKHFADMDKSQREKYNIDTEGLSELTNSYMQDGNLEALTAVSEITAPFMQDMISRSMNEYSPEMAEQMAEQRQAEKEQEAREREEERRRQMQERIVERQGQPRDDLERFTGVYGDPEADDSTRRLWVQVSCDGYLVSGAMWGDASPWWLRSESDNVFTYQNSFNDLRIEFKTDATGNSVEMVHDLEFMESPLKRVGPLPDDWGSCLERMQ